MMMNEQEMELLLGDGMYDWDADDSKSTVSSASTASSSRLPRCAVVSFCRDGNSVHVRPRALTDTAGIAARIRAIDHSSFMLEEHSSRALHFAAHANRPLDPITFSSKGLQPSASVKHGGSPTLISAARFGSSSSEEDDSMSSIVISTSDTTQVSRSEGVPVIDLSPPKRTSGLRNFRSGRRSARHGGSAMQRASSRSTPRPRKKATPEDRPALSRLVAFMARFSHQSAKSSSSVSSTDSYLFRESRTARRKRPHHPTKTPALSCFTRPKETVELHASTSCASDAYAAFTTSYGAPIARKTSNWKLGRPRQPVS